MAVYVDPLCNYGWKYGPSCHLFADGVDELHAFADRLGMLRSWFQNEGSMPHYDLTANKRLMAVMLGAVELDRRQAFEKRQAIKAARDGGCRR